jgi:hypothetical protein
MVHVHVHRLAIGDLDQPRKLSGGDLTVLKGLEKGHDPEGNATRISLLFRDG